MKRTKCLALAGLLATLTTVAHAADAPAAKEYKIEPKIIELKEFTVAGIATFATPQSGQFPELWNKFPQHVGEEGLETGTYAYGVELYPPTFEKERKFTYLAAMAVADSRKVPLHLVTRTLPAATYAAFAVPGSLKGLGEAFRYIYKEWLPNAPYEIAYPFDMERYDVSPAAVKAGNMPIEILLPIKEKK